MLDDDFFELDDELLAAASQRIEDEIEESK